MHKNEVHYEITISIHYETPLSAPINMVSVICIIWTFPEKLQFIFYERNKISFLYYISPFRAYIVEPHSLLSTDDKFLLSFYDRAFIFWLHVIFGSGVLQQYGKFMVMVALWGGVWHWVGMKKENQPTTKKETKNVKLYYRLDRADDDDDSTGLAYI